MTSRLDKGISLVDKGLSLVAIASGVDGPKMGACSIQRRMTGNGAEVFHIVNTVVSAKDTATRLVITLAGE